MTPEAIAQVRRFNRLVTQRVGALDDRYLARDRPLGEARLLWEIGREGCDVRSLRARSISTRATSVDCCAGWRPPGWSASSRARGTAACARRA
jgi:hypothetical protein